MSVAQRAQRSQTTVPEARGSNGIGHTRIADLQRARIISAMFDVACERGAGSVSVAHVVERSGVSRRTFYESFSDRDDCFLAAFDDAVRHARERVLPAYRSQNRWRERVRAGLVAFLSFLEEEPVIGRVLVAESLAGDARTLERRGGVIAQITSAVDEGRTEAKGETVPPLAAEGVVGGALSVIYTRLLAPGGESLVELTNPLMSMIVLPFLGMAAARRELKYSLPARAGGEHDALLLSDPFKGAGMRLTYRTVRVLMAIAEHPQASNRLVGELAGMSDQGQISKLLGRLQRIGLLENSGLVPGQGAPNAWALTAKGRQVTDSIRAHSERQT